MNHPRSTLAQSPDRFHSPGGLSGYAPFGVLSQVTGSQTFGIQSFRDFGWLDTSPVISMRTVNESAVVAQQMNAQIPNLPPGFSGPGKDCSKIDNDVWTCYRQGIAVNGGVDCQKKCTPYPQVTPHSG